MSYAPQIWTGPNGEKLHADSGVVFESVSADGEMALPVVIRQSFDGTSTPVSIYSDAPMDLRVVDASVIITATGASATTISVTDGTNDITNAMDIYNTGSISDTDVIRAGQINDDNWDIDEGGSLELSLSDTTDSPSGVVVVHALAR